MLVAGCLGALCVFFCVLAIRNQSFNLSIAAFELVLALLAIKLGTLSHRLITGRGIKGGPHLMSNGTLLFWGTVFGVAGVMEVGLALFMLQLALLFPAAGSLVLGLGAYALVRKRKSSEIHDEV
jgi:hypothetical protein